MYIIVRYIFLLRSAIYLLGVSLLVRLLIALLWLLCGLVIVPKAIVLFKTLLIQCEKLASAQIILNSQNCNIQLSDEEILINGIDILSFQNIHVFLKSKLIFISCYIDYKSTDRHLYILKFSDEQMKEFKKLLERHGIQIREELHSFPFLDYGGFFANGLLGTLKQSYSK